VLCFSHFSGNMFNQQSKPENWPKDQMSRILSGPPQNKKRSNTQLWFLYEPACAFPKVWQIKVVLFFTSSYKHTHAQTRCARCTIFIWHVVYLILVHHKVGKVNDQLSQALDLVPNVHCVLSYLNLHNAYILI